MEEVRGLREEVGRIDRDMARDREGFEDFRVQMDSMKSEIKQLRSEMGVHADRVKDKVTDALQPAVKSVKTLSNEIKKKKTIYIFKDGFKDWVKSKWMNTVGKFHEEIKKEVRG